jgi:Mg2+ and Co2+ transporter CorA
VTVRLFDADRTDTVLELESALRRRLNDRQLLWIDINGDLDAKSAEAVAQRMDLKPRTRRVLVAGAQGASIVLHGTYLHIRVVTDVDPSPSEGPRWLDLIAAKGIVVSVHREPIDVLRGLDDRIEEDTTVGSIDGPAFVHSVLNGVVTGYFRAVDAIEDEIDKLDGQALRKRLGEDILGDLVRLRRKIARLRRALSDQRDVFAALRTAEFGAAIEGEDVADFAALADRFENALRSVEDSRDLLIGSFDVFMTRTAQTTNDVMKVLALATVLLLPGSLIAGLLGMNVDVPLPKDGPVSFWLVVVAIAVLASVVLGIARWRRWI